MILTFSQVEKGIYSVFCGSTAFSAKFYSILVNFSEQKLIVKFQIFEMYLTRACPEVFDFIWANFELEQLFQTGFLLSSTGTISLQSAFKSYSHGNMGTTTNICSICSTSLLIFSGQSDHFVRSYYQICQKTATQWVHYVKISFEFQTLSEIDVDQTESKKWLSINSFCINCKIWTEISGHEKRIIESLNLEIQCSVIHHHQTKTTLQMGWFGTCLSNTPWKANFQPIQTFAHQNMVNKSQ